jgi:hypothetical protein
MRRSRGWSNPLWWRRCRPDGIRLRPDRIRSRPVGIRLRPDRIRLWPLWFLRPLWNEWWTEIGDHWRLRRSDWHIGLLRPCRHVGLLRPFWHGWRIGLLRPFGHNRYVRLLWPNCIGLAGGCRLWPKLGRCRGQDHGEAKKFVHFRSLIEY